MNLLKLMIALAVCGFSVHTYANDTAQINQCGTYSVADDFYGNGSIRIATGDTLVNISSDAKLIGSVIGMESDVAESFSNVEDGACVCLGGTIHIGVDTASGAEIGTGVISDLDYMAPVADASSVPVCADNKKFSECD